MPAKYKITLLKLSNELKTGGQAVKKAK